MKNNAVVSIKNQDEINTGLLVSLLCHLLIVLFFTVKIIFFPQSDFNEPPAIRVDLVALPDKTLPTKMPEPQKAEAPEAKAPPLEVAPVHTPPKLPPKVEIQKDALNLDKIKTKQKDALNKLKSLEALEKIEKDLAKEKKKQDALAAASKIQNGAVKIKGNQIAAGTSLTGVEKLEHESYKSDIDHHIKQFWVLPEWLARKKLNAKILIRIDEKGRLISKKIVQSSGDSSFDESALSTIDQAVPLPTPPDKFILKVSVEGILIEFGAEEVSS